MGTGSFQEELVLIAKGQKPEATAPPPPPDAPWEVGFYPVEVKEVKLATPKYFSPPHPHTAPGALFIGKARVFFCFIGLLILCGDSVSKEQINPRTTKTDSSSL